jgi:hypothetical protein
VPKVVYSYLYDAMIAWYMAQRYSAGPYVHWYAITTLTSMGFLNVVSALAVSAHWEAVWAGRLIETRDPVLFVLPGVGLLSAHILFSKWRRARALQTRSLPPSRWLALGYIAVSVVIFMYTSSLVHVTRV